jgi:hypothetical protein
MTLKKEISFQGNKCFTDKMSTVPIIMIGFFAGTLASMRGSTTIRRNSCFFDAP